MTSAVALRQGAILFILLLAGLAGTTASAQALAPTACAVATDVATFPDAALAGAVREAFGADGWGEGDAHSQPSPSDAPRAVRKS